MTFNAPKTILVGDNAQGKSNVLEAVELLATLRSHRAARDRDLVETDQPESIITARVRRIAGQTGVAMTLRSSGRRTVAINGEVQKRQLDFLGAVKAVQFSSVDLDLVRGGPGERRRWLDGLLVQLEPVYAHILHQYQTVLKQRNALLKKRRSQLADSGTTTIDSAQLAVWDAQLAATGTRVVRRRARAVARLAPIAQQWHQDISGQVETLSVGYSPNVPLQQDDAATIQQAFLEKIQQRAIAEQYQGTSLVGPHRDEIDFLIDQSPARQYGSQGQQRTLVLALKLAELTLIESVVGEPPLLLLDDVLAELDLKRQSQLLDTIQGRFQTLITATHLSAFEVQWMKAAQILTVETGCIYSRQCE